MSAAAVIAKRPGTLEYVTIPEDHAARYEAQGWVRVGRSTHPAPATAVEPLRGQALTAALKNAGLPTYGTVAEKRARLAASSTTTPEEQS